MGTLYYGDNLDILRRYVKEESNQQQYPQVQLRTVAELMARKGIQPPSSTAALDETFKEAPKAKGKTEGQQRLEI